MILNITNRLNKKLSMMSKITSKSGLSRICLLSIILLCTMFTSENAFSRPWQNNMEVKYDKKNGTVTILYLYYDYNPNTQVHSYLSLCSLKYSQNGVKFTNLIDTYTNKQDIKNVIWMNMTNLNPNGYIAFPDMKLKRWGQLGKQIGNRLTDCRYQYGSSMVSSKNACMVIKWTLPKTITNIKEVQFSGTWSINDETAVKKVVENKIEELFTLSK